MIAQDALLRLERLGFIEKHKGSDLRLKRGENTTVNHPQSTVALRKMQRQILEMAINAMENVPIEYRDQSTITMGLDDSQMPEAKERIKQFRREICKTLQKTKKRNSVYQFTISLYPVTNREKTQGVKT